VRKRKELTIATWKSINAERAIQPGPLASNSGTVALLVGGDVEAVISKHRMAKKQSCV
jgi:hypothetical protein